MHYSYNVSWFWALGPDGVLYVGRISHEVVPTLHSIGRRVQALVQLGAFIEAGELVWASRHNLQAHHTEAEECGGAPQRLNRDAAKQT